MAIATIRISNVNLHVKSNRLRNFLTRHICFECSFEHSTLPVNPQFAASIIKAITELDFLEGRDFTVDAYIHNDSGKTDKLKTLEAIWQLLD